MPVGTFANQPEEIDRVIAMFKSDNPYSAAIMRDKGVEMVIFASELVSMKITNNVRTEQIVSRVFRLE
jgi:hypothetical protein